MCGEIIGHSNQDDNLDGEQRVVGVVEEKTPDMNKPVKKKKEKWTPSGDHGIDFLGESFDYEDGCGGY